MDFIDDFQSLESISSGLSPQKTPGKNVQDYPTPGALKRSAAHESPVARPLTSTIKDNSSSSRGYYYSHGGISSHLRRSRMGVGYGTSALTRTTPNLVTWEPPLSVEPYISEEALERRLKRAERHWKRQRLRWCIISTRHICVRRLWGRAHARTAWETHIKHSCCRAIRIWRSHRVSTVRAHDSLTLADDHYRLYSLKLGLSSLKRRVGTLLIFIEARTVGEQHWRNRRVTQAIVQWGRALEISSVLRNRLNVAEDHYSRRWVMIESGGPFDHGDGPHVEKMGEYNNDLVKDLNFSSFSLNDGVGIEDVTYRDDLHRTRLHSVSRAIFDNGNGSGIGSNNLNSNSPFATFRSVPWEYSPHVQCKKWPPPHSLESPFIQYKAHPVRVGNGVGDYNSPQNTSSFQHRMHHGSYMQQRYFFDFDQEVTHNHRASPSYDSDGIKQVVPSSVLSSPAVYPIGSEVDEVYHEEHAEEVEHNTKVFSTSAPNSVLGGGGALHQQDGPVGPPNIDCDNDAEAAASFSLNGNARTHFPIGGREVKAVPEFTEFNGEHAHGGVSSCGLKWNVVPDSKLPSCIDTASFVSSREVEIGNTIDSSKAHHMVTDGPYNRWGLQNSLDTGNNFVEMNNATAARYNRQSSRCVSMILEPTYSPLQR